MPDSPEPTPAQILATPMPRNDADATTIRGYLINLLATVWDEEAGFSGKRPFGNSGWQYEVYRALVAAGHVPGAFDENGYLDDVDTKVCDRLVAAAIASLGTEASR